MSTSEGKVFYPPTIHTPVSTSSHVGVTPLGASTRSITIAGQNGKRPSGETSSDFGEQVNVALDNADRPLEAAGGEVRDIVRVTQYVVILLPQDKRRGEA